MFNNVVIAAVKSNLEFESALKTDVKIIFHLAPNIISLKENVEKAHKYGKKIFIHIDLAEGVGKDRYGLKFIKLLQVDGVISTRSSVIKLAKEEELYSVQRFFIVDTKSVETIVNTAKSSKADMIEVMPGVVPKVISFLKEKTDIPIIAGGLIDRKEEVAAAIKHGAYAVSTGCELLWEEENGKA